MDSANQTQQTLVYADGYSYTEFFQAPEQPEAPGTDRLIGVYHALYSPDHPVVLTTTQKAVGDLSGASPSNSQLA